jgi:hypothetical protein
MRLSAKYSWCNAPVTYALQILSSFTVARVIVYSNQQKIYDFF